MRKAAYLLVAALLAACASQPTPPSTRQYLGTQAPGDVWTWSLTPTTFSASNETTGFNYSGTLATLPSGYLKLTVNASSEPGVPTDGSAQAYALEVPGTALIVKPVGSQDAPVVAVAQGACPSSGSYGFNYVSIPKQTWNPEDDAYGKADVTISGSGFNATITPRKIDGSTPSFATGPGGTSSGSGTCTAGRLTITGDTSITSFTPSGIGITDHGPGKGGNVALSRPSANINWADFSSKNFRGVLWERHNGGNGMVEEEFPLYLEPGPSGMKAGRFSDVETGAKETAFSTVNLGTQPDPGLLRVNVSSSEGTPPTVVFMVNKIEGKYFVFGVAARPGSPEISNFLLMQQ